MTCIENTKYYLNPQPSNLLIAIPNLLQMFVKKMSPSHDHKLQQKRKYLKNLSWVNTTGLSSLAIMLAQYFKILMHN